MPPRARAARGDRCNRAAAGETADGSPVGQRGLTESLRTTAVPLWRRTAPSTGQVSVAGFCLGVTRTVINIIIPSLLEIYSQC